MTNQLNSHPSFMWWARDDAKFSEPPSRTPSLIGIERIRPTRRPSPVGSEHVPPTTRESSVDSEHISVISRPSSVGSNHISVVGDSVITLPTQGTVTPATTRANTPVFSGGASPEIRRKIANASPETARHVALRMYESMKRHGLREEARKVVGKEENEIEEIKEGGVDRVRRKSEDLMGMDYLLRDGFVSYLRDMAKITPPIPQQVISFLYVSLIL
jgi:hypothetical protein